LKRLFKTFDANGNGLLEFKEFKRAIKEFKLGLEDQDIDNIFKSFDVNGDGVLDLTEFMDMILGNLPLNR
jgi:Ca2+-binding EF-hand superfamily protein